MVLLPILRVEIPLHLHSRPSIPEGREQEINPGISLETPLTTTIAINLLTSFNVLKAQ